MHLNSTKQNSCQSIWGLNSTNQDMPKTTGWVSLRSTQNSTDTGVVVGANSIKSVANYKEIILDFPESLTCKDLAHRQSLE